MHSRSRPLVPQGYYQNRKYLEMDVIIKFSKEHDSSHLGNLYITGLKRFFRKGQIKHPPVIVRLYDPQQSMPSVEIASKRQAAREVIDILSEISLILVCLSACSSSVA